MSWGSPTWIVIIVLLWFLFAMWSQHRPHATDHPKTCRDCGATHPQFARFCRHCGKLLDKH